MSYENLGRGIDRIRVIVDRISLDLEPSNTNLQNSELILAELNYISQICNALAEALKEDLSDAYQYSD